MRATTLFTILVGANAGCPKKSSEPASSSAPEQADAAVAVDGAVAIATPTPDAAAVPKQADCLARDPDNPVGYAISRVGGQLVICGSGEQGIASCWTVDARSGKLTPRSVAPLPGTGFAIASDKLPKPSCYQDLCWPAAATDGDDEGGDVVHVAFHPDGKRAAILANMQVTVFDLASKRPTTAFPLRKSAEGDVADGELSNSPRQIWFAGETVYVRGNDAGPASYLFPYTTTGRPTRGYAGLYHGEVAVSEGRVVINEDALSTLTIIDGKSRKMLRRKIPRGPCKLDDNPEWSMDSNGPGHEECQEYIAKHFVPYESAAIIPDGAGFIGLANDGTLLQIDGKSLAATARAQIPECVADQF
jgi:hypothetical protein